VSRKALLVGNSNYDDGALPKLAAPVRDVSEMDRVLGDPALGAFTVRSVVNAGVVNIRIAVEKLFRDAKRGDLVLLYFSGHGSVASSGELHLCAVDTAIDVLSSTGVSLRWVRDQIDRCRARSVVIVLDCCYSGAAKSAFKGTIPDILQTGIGEGRGKYLVTSSSALQPSADGNNLSLFTRWFVEGIEKGAAALDSGLTSVDGLFRYTSRKVTDARPEQQPKSWGFEVTPGDITISQISIKPQLSPGLELDSLSAEAPRRIVRQLAGGRAIPFLGPAVYGGGPLSAFALSRAFARESGLSENTVLPVATSAEHLQRVYNDDRIMLLDSLRDILDRQQKRASADDRLTHTLVLRSLGDGAAKRAPSVVVSATYDDVFERRLASAGVAFTTLSHVLDAEEPALVGRLVVVEHHGDKTRAHVEDSDRWLPSESTRVIVYKVLGSPAINALAIDGCEGDVDTVVLTESDHVTFLGNLRHQSTRLPAALGRCFKRRPSCSLDTPSTRGNTAWCAGYSGLRGVPGRRFAYQPPRLRASVGVDSTPT